MLKKEREGGYLGRDVQVIPHVVGEIKLKLRELAAKSNADVVFVEVGGTVGDYENSVLPRSLPPARVTRKAKARSSSSP